MPESNQPTQAGEPKKARTKKDLKELREEALKPLNAELVAPVAKTVYTYAELFEKRTEEAVFLIPELLPAHSVAVFIGEDGIGKTQLCTQLCLHTAFGYPSFLGLPLNIVHKRALICATEDSGKKWIKSAVKQQMKLEPNVKPGDINLHFMEAYIFDEFKELKDALEAFLKAYPTDVVVLDALSDAFTLIDGEINSNKDARLLIKFLQYLCETYHTTVIVIHHAAKTKMVAKRNNGKIFIEKDDSQGAGAITQKPRTVLALSHDKKSVSEDGLTYTNYLHAVKANEMGKHYMKNAVQLQFNGLSLLHKNTGLVDIELLEETATPAEVNTNGGYNGKKATPGEIPNDQHKELVAKLLRAGEEIARKELVQKLAAAYGVGNTKIEASVQNNGFLAYLLDNGYLVKTAAGMYKKKPATVAPQSIIQLEDEESF